MNIALTTACNNHCPFCFQKDLHKAPQSFDLKTLEKVLDWGAQTYPQKIGILGGEPTLYPFFIEAIDMVMQKFYFAEILLITNLLGSSQNFEYLKKYPDIRYLINISFDDSKIMTFFSNLEIIKFSPNLCLSMTLTRDCDLNKKYISRLQSILITYPQIKELRIGLECPSATETQDFNYNYDNEILYLIEELPKYDHGLFVHFDCPLNLCQLSYKIVEKINNGETIFKPNINYICSSPCIDIMPDLSAGYCFSSSYRVNNILDFKDIDTLLGYFRTVNSNYIIKNPKCINCHYHNVDCFPCHAFDMIWERGK